MSSSTITCSSPLGSIMVSPGVTPIRANGAVGDGGTPTAAPVAVVVVVPADACAMRLSVSSMPRRAASTLPLAPAAASSSEALALGPPPTRPAETITRDVGCWRALSRCASRVSRDTASTDVGP